MYHKYIIGCHNRNMGVCKMERIKQWHEQNNFKRMAMRVLALIMALNMLLVMLPAAEIGGIVNAAEGEAKVFTPADTFDTDYGYNDLAIRSNGAKRQELYGRIETAADAFAASTDDFADDVICEIDISDLGLSYDEITETYFTLKHDNPQYYWLSSTLSLVGMDLQLMTSEDYRKYSDRKACDEIIAEKLAEYDAIVENLTSNYEVALAIHDKMIADIEYSYEADGVTPSTAISAHNIIGVFDDDIALAVCEGYTSAYQMLLNRYGINNVYVTGESYGDNHAWNMVQMDDGKYYLTDVTWDDTRVSADENGVDMPSYAFFNMASSDFNKDHTANTTEGTSIYFLYELPEAADAYDYTFYKMNAGLIDKNVVAEDDNNNNDLVIKITSAIKNAFSNGGSVVYLYGQDYDGKLMENDMESVGMALQMASRTAEETAFYEYTVLADENECIIEFITDPSVRQENIELYNDDALCGTFATLDGALEQMTDKDGKYTIKLDGKAQGNYFLSPIHKSFPEVASVTICSEKSVSDFFYLPSFIITDDFTMSGNITVDFAEIWDYVKPENRLLLSNAVVTMYNYAKLSVDVHADNSEIICEYSQGNSYEINNLYGDCDVTLSGHGLSVRGNAEIDTLSVMSTEEGYTGTLNLSNYSAESTNTTVINKIVSQNDSPIRVSGNNHEITINDIEVDSAGWNIYIGSLDYGDYLPKITVEKMDGITEVDVRFSLSTSYLTTDPSGNQTGSWTEICDKSIVENSDGFFVCYDSENIEFSASYYSNLEVGKFEVINNNGVISARVNDELVEYYYIYLYSNDETDKCKIMTKDYGVDVNLDCSYTREGYCFIEWNTAKDGSGVSYAYDAIYSEDNPLTLYAQWEVAGNHKFETVVTEPGCEKKGYTTHTCIDCGFVYIDSETPATGHLEEPEITEPSCEDEGYTTYTCILCGEFYIDEYTDAIGHDYEKGKTIAPTCLYEGWTEYKCTRCGINYVDDVTPALGHAEVYVPAIIPTCEWPGLTEGTKCSVCDEVLSGQKFVGAAGHTEVTDAAVAPTCTATGLTEGKHCSVCGEIIVAQTVVGELEHSWKDSTCTAPKTCSVCGTTEGNATGHSWKDATCKAPKTCSTCGTTTGKKAAHVYDDKVDGTCNACGIHRENTEKRTVMNMFRMYDPNSGEHFYTGSEVERDNLVAEGWCYEGVGFTFSMTTGAPVYRLYDPVTGEHLYTMDEEEKAMLLDAGWNYEGIAFNSAYDTEVPQYRLYNPNETRGAYHFTASIEERDFLLSIGWEDQGIGFYSSWK